MWDVWEYTWVTRSAGQSQCSSLYNGKTRCPLEEKLKSLIDTSKGWTIYNNTCSGSSKKAGAASASAVVPASQSLLLTNHAREDLVPEVSFCFLCNRWSRNLACVALLFSVSCCRAMPAHSWKKQEHVHKIVGVDTTMGISHTVTPSPQSRLLHEYKNMLRRREWLEGTFGNYGVAVVSVDSGQISLGRDH